MKRLPRAIAASAVLTCLYGFEGCQPEPCPPGAITELCSAPTDDASADGQIDGGGGSGGDPQGGTVEDCNGIDDDGDGRADEELSPLPTVCGDGPCDRGQRLCEDGRWVDTCVQRAPAPERCDGIDNDCNGLIDDIGGAGADCYTGPAGTEGVGTCASGRWACDAARGIARCSGEVTPQLESIDGGQPALDEDCDGTLDEADIACASCEGPSVSVSTADLVPGRRYPVIVFLERTAPLDDRAARVAEVADRQRRVIRETAELAAFGGNHFEESTRYRHLHAFVAEADPIALEHLVRHPLVEAVVEDLPVEAALTSAKDLIGADRAQREGAADGRGARVLSADTGIDYTHPAFGACDAVGDEGCRVVDGVDLVDGDDDPLDEDGHGTASAAIIAGQSVRGAAAGIAPAAELIAVRVLADQHAANLNATLDVLDWLHERGGLAVDTVYLGYATERPFTPAHCLAFGAPFLPVLAEWADLLFVGPMGNAARPCTIGFPACLTEHVLAVGAVYDTPTDAPPPYEQCRDVGPIAPDDVPCFTNGRALGAPGGSCAAAVEAVLAPGADVRTATLHGGYATRAGTSLAAAMVAGAAAMLRGVRPHEDAQQIRARILSTAVEVPDPSVVLRRLDVWAALDRQCLDGDGDGHGAEGPDCPAPLDCDDADFTVYPDAPERCDHRDNDCDGDTDEGLGLGDPCHLGRGACRRGGVQVCSEDGVICDAAPGEPVAELCNAVDDDCDGSTDEDFPTLGQGCSAGEGECRRDGVQVCHADALTCDAVPGAPQREERNRRDDDCDGALDEDTCRLIEDDLDDEPDIGHCNGRPGDEGTLARCLAENGMPRGCNDRELRAWCHRRIDDGRLWEQYFEDEARARWPTECAPDGWITNRDLPGHEGEKWTYCVDLSDDICPETRLGLLTPLVLRYGPFGAGPAYQKASGRFDLSRHQDGSGETAAWVVDPILITRPAPGEPLTARHLFGEATLDAEGKPSFVDGFDALAARADADGDGWVSGDELDPLGEWRDLDADRAVDPGEVTALTERGVLAIRVEPFSWDRAGWHPDGLGFVEGRARLYFTDPDGALRLGEVMDVYLR